MLGRLKFEIDDFVNEILDMYPEELWTSDSTTFLDPSMGGGQYIRAIEKRLKDAGHSDANIASRVFGFESNPMRVNFARNKYKTLGTYFNKNFLEEEFQDKFDVVVCGPQFQRSNASDRMGSRGATSIWDLFVTKGLELLKPNGYMTFVHPPAWRKPNDRYGLWKELTQKNQMLFLKMRHGRNEQDVFKRGNRFDYYIVKKTPKFTTTRVVDHEDKTYDLDLSKFDWLPNYAIDEIVEMLDNGDVLYNTFYHTQHDHKSEQTDEYCYPVVHTINKEGLGIKYFKKKETNIHFGVPKVLLNQNELQYPVNDYKGEYGMSQLTFGIPISSKEEGDKIVEFLNSEKGKRIIAATKWNTYYTDYNMFYDLKISG